MSRVGKLPIAVPSGVTITVDDEFVTVTGPKGTLKQFTMPGIAVVQEDGKLTVNRASDEREHRAKHGLMRALINNMVVGVTTGFSKKLEINGVGYRANVAGKVLNLSLGYSHPIVFNLPEGITATVEGNVIAISGIDNELIGNIAYKIRKFRKPEPYKGKGVKYETEVIRRKAGKSAAKGK